MLKSVLKRWGVCLHLTHLVYREEWWTVEKVMNPGLT